MDIYVALSGSDHNAGTKEKPLASVAMALRKARELRRLNDPSVKTGIRIIVAPGIYRFSEPLFIRPEDSGTESSPTIIEAAAGETPVFSGGMQLTGWRKVTGRLHGLPKEASGKIWMAETGIKDFRQLWVNNVKAVRARENDVDSMDRILSWDHSKETCRIPVNRNSGFTMAEGMEMVIHQWWAIAILRIRSMQIKGDSAELSFHQPESRIQSEHPWPAPWISKETGNSAFYLVNALQFLDQPGEWFLDQKTQRVYYYPRNNEDMRTATITAPLLETLVRIEGSPDRPVAHVYFKGISFQHTGWLRPSQQGHVPHQAGMYMLDAYKLKIPGTPDKSSLENQAWVGRPAAAVEANFAHHTGFEHCSFIHLASTGLDYKKGNRHGLIQGNVFKDIGGSAILAGVFSDEATEVHLPYNPSDEREITGNLRISNNLVTDATNEDWGCVGIGAGYVRDISIDHNEICEISYTGISLGWGWTKTVNAMRNNKVIANKIHHFAKHLYDVAAIYTLSAQPGTVISENYIDSIYVAPYAHIPSHWFYLYTDEGTSQVTVKDNWCPSEKFLQNANGPGNEWLNNGPQVPNSIKDAAGIQAKYQHLLKEKSVSAPRAINHYKPAPATSQQATARPVIIEVVANTSNKIDAKELGRLFQNFSIDPDSLYGWENHYAVFSKLQDPEKIRTAILEAFPGASVKIYDQIFYEFNRNRCDSAGFSKDWDHILLTADLVEDTMLQKEYLDHHATQFEKWPEITRGFCNASFQQLLLYRNGRQLMLVISIPRGESLDKLNSKTTENNPRVAKWNNLMKKYQQGIEGTRKNEVWVFLKPVMQTNSNPK